MSLLQPLRPTYPNSIFLRSCMLHGVRYSLAVTQRACLQSNVTHLWLHAFEEEVLDKFCHQLQQNVLKFGCSFIDDAAYCLNSLALSLSSQFGTCLKACSPCMPCCQSSTRYLLQFVHSLPNQIGSDRMRSDQIISVISAPYLLRGFLCPNNGQDTPLGNTLVSWLSASFCR